MPVRFVIALAVLLTGAPAQAQFGDIPTEPVRQKPAAAPKPIAKVAPAEKATPLEKAAPSEKTKPARAEPSQGLPKLPTLPGVSDRPLQQGTPMRVMIVRGGKLGCSTDCREWIAAQGMIDAQALPQFRKVLKSLGGRKLPILIDSDGGMVDESFAIGRLIRAKGLDVAIAKSITVPCPAEDASCRPAKGQLAVQRALPVASRARCASACAFILAAGVHRYVGPRTIVGVHQLRSFQVSAQLLRKYHVYTKQTLFGPQVIRRQLISEKRVNERSVETHTPDSAYRSVAAYFTEMGIGAEIMPMLRSAPNGTMHWMTRSDLAKTRLSTEPIDGEELITGQFKPLQPAALPQLAPGANATLDAFVPVEGGIAANALAKSLAVPCGTAGQVDLACGVALTFPVQQSPQTPPIAPKADPAR